MIKNINYLFRYLSNKTKRDIIMHLYLCKCLNCCVNCLSISGNYKQSNISKHLIDLKKKNFVYKVKNKNKRQYFLTNEFIKCYEKILLILCDEYKEICKCCEV